MAKKQQKKPSQKELDGNSIRTLMGTEGRTPLVISQITGGHRLYVASDNKGMVFYEYGRNYEHNFIKKGEHQWGDFTNVVVDHFAVKTVLNFSGDNTNLDIVLMEKGKEFVQVIDSYSHISIQTLQRAVWNKVLGFRSRTKWKMYTASIGYAIAFLMVVTIFSGNEEATTKQKVAQTSSSATVSKPVELTPEQKAQQEAEAKAKQEAEAKAAAEAAKPENVAQEVFSKHFEKASTTFNPENGVLTVQALGHDNFTEAMIKKGMWMDVHDSLKDLKDNQDIKTITVSVLFPMQDAYGNSSDDAVMKMTFGPETRSKINWENFTWSGIPKIAEDYWEHPYFRKIDTN